MPVADYIIQVSTGGGAFAAGSSVKDMALGAISIAEHVHRAAGRFRAQEDRPCRLALEQCTCLDRPASGDVMKL